MGALLPLAAKAKKVALIGPLADNQREMLGAWAVTGDPKYVVTLKTALAERLGDRLLYAQGCELLSGDDANVLKRISFNGPIAADASIGRLPTTPRRIAEAVETAKKADVAILALGEPANWMEGEASSRASLGFTGAQQQLLEAVAATGKPVILVVLAGRPLELKWAASHVPAILEAWSPGIEAGHAVADVLFGDVNPSGKLPVEPAPRRRPGAALLCAAAHRPAGARRPEPHAAECRREVHVALHGRGELGALSLWLGIELHALQLSAAEHQPRRCAGARSACRATHR